MMNTNINFDRDEVLKKVREQDRLKYDIISKLYNLWDENDIISKFISGYRDIIKTRNRKMSNIYTYNTKCENKYKSIMSKYLNTKLPDVIRIMYNLSEDSNKVYILMDPIKEIFMNGLK